MANRNLISQEELIQERWKDEGFRKTYRLLKPKYDVVRELINLRSSRGITQAELAKRIGSHQSRISKIESAEDDLRLSTLIELANAMDADVCIYIVPRLQPSLYSELQKLLADLPQENDWDAPRMPDVKVSRPVFG
jgi:transcriptional regulator with XRE-family HTH domain